MVIGDGISGIGSVMEGFETMTMKWAKPRYSKLSVFLGDLAEWFSGFAYWMAIPLWILRRPLRALMTRKALVRWHGMSLTDFLVVGAAAGAVIMSAYLWPKRRMS